SEQWVRLPGGRTGSDAPNARAASSARVETAGSPSSTNPSLGERNARHPRAVGRRDVFAESSAVTPPSTERRQAYIALVGLSLTWGYTWVVIKVATFDASPMIVASGRMLIGVLVLF